MNFAFYKFIFGMLKIGYTGNKITYIGVSNKIDCNNQPSDISNSTFKQIEEYLDGKRNEFDFEYTLVGTEFQKRVWKELVKIPYGETISYKEVALAIGNPNASRAVGMAVNKNPLMIVIPCHRVIGTNKKLVGYAYGLEMKKTLINIEKNNK